MVERELENDRKIHEPGKTKIAEAGTGLTIVDYGSNSGYFSIQMASKFSEATVVSLEEESGKDYDGGSNFHATKMKEIGIENNYICRATVVPATFAELRQAGQVFDYQLCLDWFVPLNARKVFGESLANQLLNARTTFIELPEAMDYTGDEVAILEMADKYKFKVKVKILGAITLDNGALCKILRVDVDVVPQLDLKTLFETYKCSDNGGT